MATKLGLYNEALTEHLGERKLASLTEDREPLRVMDDIWDNGVVKYCLEQGTWKFGKRSSSITYDTTVSPTFGYQYAFAKPSDLVKVTKVCSDEFFQCPLTAYTEEEGYYFSDVQEIFIEYISDAATHGNNLADWPETFTKYVAAQMAYRGSKRLGMSAADRDLLKKERDKLLKDARSKDAMQGPTQFFPSGSWTNSRGNGRSRLDRGSKSSLLG